MDPNRQIRTFLHNVRIRHRRRALAGALLAAGLPLALLSLFAPLAAAAWNSAALSVVAGGVAAVAVAAAVVLYVAERRRTSSDRGAARFVGLRERAIASDLLSAVELAERPDLRASEDLTRALFASSAERATALSIPELVPFAPLRRRFTLFFTTVLACAIAAAIAPDRLRRGWERLLSGGEPQPFAGAAFVAEPLVGDVDIELAAPAYARRDVARLTAASGDFQALAGTEVSIRTRSLGPVSKARIVFSETPDGDDDESVELRVKGDELTGSFVAREARYYRFLVYRPSGEREVEANPRRIDIEADLVPSVELHTPADELDVADLRRIEIAYVAEDDFGLTRARLVVQEPGETPHYIALPLPTQGDPEGQPRAAQAKYTWDLAEIDLSPGKRVRYYAELFDNDDVSGPKAGRSRDFFLRVFSPRERHQELLDRQAELLDQMLELLGDRLVVEAADVATHRALSRTTQDLVVQLGTAAAALKDDDLADSGAPATIEKMRTRLDVLARAEVKLLEKLAAHPNAGRLDKAAASRVARSDAEHITELEDDVLILADWLERQEMENVLAISDEIDGHRKQLDELFEEYQRTGSEEILEEIDREMRNLEQKLAEMATRQNQIPADVLDQFANAEAVQAPEALSCLGEARKLLEAGEVERAQKKMQECADQLAKASDAMEQALEELRADRFPEEEQKLEALKNDLADLALDQKAIADESEDLYETYAEDAAELMKERAGETRKDVGETLQKLRRRLSKIPDGGLTEFGREERQILDKRLEDVKQMLARGDVAEALSMARQAEASLETLGAEIEASLEDDWSKKRKEAASAVDRAAPLARQLVEELEKATPSPEQIMSGKDRRRLERLRKRQASVRQRTQKLAEKAQEQAPELPGQAGEAMAKGLGEAAGKMERAEQRMRASDPSGARQQTREAAEMLSEAQEQARGAARQRMDSGSRGLRDDTVKIPGADEYKPPERYREEVLEAMKKEEAPAGFSDMVKRYYEEIVK